MDYIRQVCVPSCTYDTWLELVVATHMLLEWRRGSGAWCVMGKCKGGLQEVPVPVTLPYTPLQLPYTLDTLPYSTLTLV